MKITIKRVGENSIIGSFIRDEFSSHAEQNNIDMNYSKFCFVAESDEDELLGVITGHVIYNEVHISDLIVKKGYRKCGLGSKLIAAVEETYTGAGYEKVTLSTYGFQAPAVYEKLGYRIECVREDRDPKLQKYFLAKPIT